MSLSLWRNTAGATRARLRTRGEEGPRPALIPKTRPDHIYNTAILTACQG